MSRPPLDFANSSSRFEIITMCFHAQAHGQRRQCALVLAILFCSASVRPLSAQQPQFRAAWADIFHVGLTSQADTDAMVSKLVAGHYNAVIVQVLGYMDN